MVSSGEIELSPDKNTLYYGDYGSSPASLYQFDVSGSTPVKTWEDDHGDMGSNGQDLELSHSGTFISYACGAGQGGYRIAKFRTSDMAILGTFDTGAYPREIAFSLYDSIAYTVHTRGLIDLWDTKTFLSLGSITTPTADDYATELIVDQTGQQLFAAFNPYGGSPVLRVYEVTPEPTCLLLFGIGFLAVIRRKRR
jgi:hypothetical protein